MTMTTFLRSKFFFALLSLMLIASIARGEISLTSGSPYTQNFDSLSNTAGSTTNSLFIPGWFIAESGGGIRDNDQYAVDNGTSNTGDTYSYGASASVERALGTLRSGTLIPIFGANFQNNTGSIITDLLISYIGEQWRLGVDGRTDQLNFEFSLDATSLETGTWTPVSALNFTTPNTVTVGAKDGNSAPNRTSISFDVAGLNIANGNTFWIRWVDIDATGADDGLAVDDFSLRAIPEPSAFILAGLGMVALLGYRRLSSRERTAG